MLHSMTGFGRAEIQLSDYLCTIEIRSLNGKQFEWNAKLPSILKPYEIPLRNLVQQALIRGSIDCSIFLRQHGSVKPMTVNTELAVYYFDAITQIARQLNLEQNDILATLMRMPEVVSVSTDSFQEEQWALVAVAVQTCCEQLIQHRITEGFMLEKQISGNIQRIHSLCTQVQVPESRRLDKLREKIQSLLSEQVQNGNIDQNRLEQELVYYIERLDITEEKNRLTHHCDYFMELLNENQPVKGKKLGFLLQEIGREINTMGSKANDATLQKLIVEMKDELEQSKEQLLNAL